MKRKRFLALALTVCMIGGMLAGCGDKSGNSVENGDVKSSESTEGLAAYFKDKEHYTLKVMCFGDADTETMEKISKKASEFTQDTLNCDVEFIRVNFGNYMTQLNMDLASGEQIDLIIPMAAPIDYVNAGQIQPIGNLIPKFAPELNTELKERDWRNNTFDGEIYGLPNLQSSTYTLGVGMRKDICDELGIDYKNMSSWDDYHDALVKVKEAYPDMYPIVSNNGNMFSGESAYTGQDSCGDSYNLAVMTDQYNENAKVENWFETDQFKEVCDRMYAWAQEGLVQPDASTSADDVNMLVSSGKAFSYFQHISPGWEEDQSAKNGFETVSWKYGETYYVGRQMAWFVPTESGDPERAVAFWNMMYNNKDLSNLVINGIEGENYVFANDEKTVITYPEGISASSAKYQRLYWEWPNSKLGYTWEGENPDIYKEQEEQNAIAKVPVCFGFNFDAAPVMNEVTACVNVYKKYVPALLCGSLDPNTTIPVLNEEMKAAGIEKIVAEKQKQFDEYRAAK